MADLMLGPIVGGLSPAGANLWGRAAGPGSLSAWIGQQPDLSDAQEAGATALTPEMGFSGVVPVAGLTPDTRYYYTLTLDGAPPAPNRGPYPGFTTFPPDGSPYAFAFAFGSCFRPDNEQGGQIFRAMTARGQADNLRFMLLLGDQIYADAGRHNSLGKVAVTLEEYRAIYAYTWSRPPLQELLANVPAFMILDDHEVDDDWTWTDSQHRQGQIPIWNRIIRWLRRRPPEERALPLKRVQAALQAYWEHQGLHAPPLLQPARFNEAGQAGLSLDDPGSLAYSFTFGAATFFVLDTRTRRVKGRQEHMMLGADQWQALEAWLLAAKDKYPLKFLVTSSALLYQLWLDLARDRWSGFPGERDRLLHFVADHRLEGVYLLAGDLHAAHAVRADLRSPQGQLTPVWEFCSSPFEQDSTWLARYTYHPLRSGPVERQKRYFGGLLGRNFGLVRVEFPAGERPQVRFEVYGEAGQLLKAVETEA